MATFAVIHGDTVSNVIVCESKELAEQVAGGLCIEYTPENPAGIGWTWDGEKFTDPDKEDPVL
jgi:hypothetical protein